MLKEAKSEYDKVIAKLKTIDINEDTSIIDLLDLIISMDGVKKSRVKEYTGFKNSFYAGSEIERKL